MNMMFSAAGKLEYEKTYIQQIEILHYIDFTVV